MSSDTETNTITKPTVDTGLKLPSMYKVIYINDDATTMEFVVESLMSVFGHSMERSTEITIEIHNEGSAVVAIFPFELAEQKGLEVTIMARNQGYPLQVRVEED